MSQEISSGGLYFESKGCSVKTFSSGCQVLDCTLGGGWAEDRIINIVGDPGSDKTGLAIEASANFVGKYPTNGQVYYAESEAAFDTGYARVLGLPEESVIFPQPIVTVEDVFEDLESVIQQSKQGEISGPVLYIIDSLDALSDRSEMDRKIDDNTYGGDKARQLSELFRRLVQSLEGSAVTAMVISQVRENMNAGSFGPRKRRAGGKALEFYCSQIVWLSRLEKLSRQIKNEKRSIGTKIKAQCTKNKIGPPFREVELFFYFNYGIDDVESNLHWLSAIGSMKQVSSQSSVKKAINEINQMSDEDYFAKRDEINNVVKQEWDAIEDTIRPKRSKYGSG